MKTNLSSLSNNYSRFIWLWNAYWPCWKNNVYYQQIWALRGQGCNGFQLSWMKELPMNNLSHRSFSFVLPEEKTNQRGLGARGAARTCIIPYSCMIENSVIALYLCSCGSSMRPVGYDTTDLFFSPASESQAKINLTELMVSSTKRSWRWK